MDAIHRCLGFRFSGKASRCLNVLELPGDILPYTLLGRPPKRGPPLNPTYCSLKRVRGSTSSRVPVFQRLQQTPGSDRGLSLGIAVGVGVTRALPGFGFRGLGFRVYCRGLGVLGFGFTVGFRVPVMIFLWICTRTVPRPMGNLLFGFLF